MPEQLNFEGSIRAALALFAVVVGVALEHFVTEPPMASELNFPTPWVRNVLYVWGLIVLVCQALRFGIGSEVHLNQHYVKHKPPGSYRRFLWDVVVLVVFGVLLVKVALSSGRGAFV